MPSSKAIELDVFEIKNTNGATTFQLSMIAMLLFSLQREKYLKNDGYKDSDEDVEIGLVSANVASIALGMDTCEDSQWVSTRMECSHIEISEHALNALIANEIPERSNYDKFYVVSLTHNAKHILQNDWKSALNHPDELMLWHEEQVFLAGGYDLLKQNCIIYQLNQFQQSCIADNKVKVCCYVKDHE